MRKLLVSLFLMSLLFCNKAMAQEKVINCKFIKSSPKLHVVSCSSYVKSFVKPVEINIKERNFLYQCETSHLTKGIMELINWAAEKVNLPPKLLAAVAQIESGGNILSRSPMGAIGVMQLMPRTAKALGVNPYNTRENILGGATYLKQQLDRYKGNIPKALAAYNAGPGAVDKWGGIPPFAETQKYISKVMANLR